GPDAQASAHEDVRGGGVDHQVGAEPTHVPVGEIAGSDDAHLGAAGVVERPDRALPGNDIALVVFGVGDVLVGVGFAAGTDQLDRATEPLGEHRVVGADGSVGQSDR